MVIPGGFSYGDYLRVGADRPLLAGDGGGDRASPARAAWCFGICNGFQVLCEAGLLPGALLPNAGLRFVCRQVDVVVANAETPFTRACAEGDVLSIPVKHTTGRYYAPPELLERVSAQGRSRSATPPATTRTARSTTSPASSTRRATSSA